MSRTFRALALKPHVSPAQAREAMSRIAPGLALSIIIAMAATFLSDHHGGPTLLYALLLGMAFHFLSREDRWARGIDFSVRTVLRIGVALLGARISAMQVAELGMLPIATVIAGVSATVLLGRGVHQKIVSEMLGHSRTAITLDLYSHVTPTMQREAVSALEAAIGASG